MKDNPDLPEKARLGKIINDSDRNIHPHIAIDILKKYSQNIRQTNNSRVNKDVSSQ